MKRNEIKNIALLELGGHFDAINSYLKVLKIAGYETHLLLRKKTADKCGPQHFADKSIYFNYDSVMLIEAFQYIKIWYYLYKNRIRKVIIYTASGIKVRNLLMFLPFPGIEFIGGIHDTRLLFNSRTQRIISKSLKKYIVLGGHILPSVRCLKNKSFSAFYPVYFDSSSRSNIVKNKEEFWVTIPGAISFRRRDYKDLLELIENKELNKSIRFIILGNYTAKNDDGNEFKSLVANSRYNDRFLFFDKFIHNDEFFAYLAESDLILPLINFGSIPFESYSKYKISGTFNLAYGFQKPMLIDEYFLKFEEFKVSSYFYNKDNFMDILNDISENRGMLNKKSIEISNYSKYDINHQAEILENFIQS